MPNIKIVNIRFNLDNDERDREILDALFQYPDGGRNQVVKEALYLYLIGGDAGGREQKPVRRALVAGKAQPSKQNSESGNQSPPVHAELHAATPGQHAEAATSIPSPSSNQKSDEEEEQVMSGLRSMIQ